MAKSKSTTTNTKHTRVLSSAQDQTRTPPTPSSKNNRFNTRLLVDLEQGKNNKRRQQQDEYDSDDMSDGTSHTSNSVRESESDSEEVPKTWQEQLLESVDDLTEKRRKGAKRITALHKIYELTSKHYSAYALDKYTDTIVTNVYNSLVKSTSTEESIECCKILSVIALTFGGSSFSSFSIDSEMVEKIMSTTLTIAQQYNNATDSDEEKVRRKALFTYTIWKFVEDTAEDLIMDKESGALSALQSFWPRVPEADYKANQQMLSESITCWSLLITLVPGHLLDKYVVPTAKTTLMKLLLNDHSQFSVKRAAAEALCLLIELTQLGMDSSQLFDAAADQVRTLSTLTERQSTKNKDKSAQKNQFRNFLLTFEEGEIPSLPLTIQGITLNFESWTKIIQYTAFKSVLKAGINEHMATNEFVRGVFGIAHIDFQSDDLKKQNLSSAEKKMYLGKGSIYHKEDTKYKNKLTRQFSQFLNQDY